MIAKVEISSRIREIVEKLFSGNSAELARKLGMKPQALQTYLKGDSIPGGLLLKRFYVLGCNINWLLTGEGHMQYGSVSTVREAEVPYGTIRRIEHLEKRLDEIDKLKARIYDLENLLRECAKENISLDFKNRVLSVLVSSTNDYLQKETINDS